MNFYYLPFHPTAKINYLHLLALYEVASYRKETGLYDTIQYQSISRLAADLKLSSSTVSRLLDNEEYSNFIEVDKENNVIRIKNYFPKGTNRAFVRLTAAEVELIRNTKKDKNLFAKYLIYTKYYCGFTKNNTDFTAKQFLAACGYATTSNDYLDKVSRFNGILTDNGLLKIETYRDELGHTRNKYNYAFS